MENEPQSKILINGDYGGFGFSTAFCNHLLPHVEQIHAEVPTLSIQEIVEMLQKNRHWKQEELRASQTVVRLAEAFGMKEAGNTYSHLQVLSVPTVLLNCVDVREYDGCESVHYDGDRYWRSLRVLALSDAETVARMDRYYELVSGLGESSTEIDGESE